MKLYGILITKDDDLIVEEWFQENHHRFHKLAVVDGSKSGLTENIARRYPNTIYLRDPQTHITDQTLRKHGWDAIAGEIERGDFVAICHVDEFYIHDPRAMMVEGAFNIVLWLPLVMLPHPSEAEAWIKSPNKSPRPHFRHYWWRTTQTPHCEHRMFRYVKEPFWNTELTVKGCGVIPHNYFSETVCTATPLYLHYKIVNLSAEAYAGDGNLKKSSLNTGLPKPVEGISDLFFWEDNPFTDGYYRFDNDHGKILERFGNPPRITIVDDKVTLVNDRMQDLMTIER
jgi:hypothetical protein